jgi:phosphoglycolate phosphatase-like HAD superfamily hydrolase
MLVFWDIDGTLLTTGRAGIFAWQEALLEVGGVEADLDGFDTRGYPDHGIARQLLVDYADIAEPDAAHVADLVRGYEDRLPASLHRRAGRVLPNVTEILERLAATEGACSLLLTGNTRRGAAAKLAHYGLTEYLRDGAFSERVGDRAEIARTALERARGAGCDAPPERVYVVGDTPHDVRCGAAIGARTVAVATGGYSAGELAGTGAWRVLAELPPAAEFLGLLSGREVPADV